MRLRGYACVAIVCIAAVCPLVYAASTRIEIAPGPSSITDEERAIQPDPAAGIEHGVVLIDETFLNDDYGSSTERQVHRRAKILSNEARDIADIEILLGPDEKITRWWAKVLLPDGTVLKFPESELVEQELARSRGISIRVLKGALPGVVPGCVIDYGYTVKSESLYRSHDIPIQRRWPVRLFRYRWKPTDYYPSGFRVYGPDGLDVESKRSTNAVLITARNLPPVPIEPLMPPAHEVQLAAKLYYMSYSDRPNSYWKQVAKGEDDASNRFFSELAEQLVSEIDVGPDTPLMEKLEAAYNWVATKVRNPLIEVAGQPLGSAEKAPGSLDTIDAVFIYAARRLGAEAHVILAPDRTEHYWDTELKTREQFDARLVAVRAPGAPDDQAILVDPSSGLAFGQIPWWVSGAYGLLASSKEPRPIFLSPGSPAANQTLARVDLRFTEDASKMEATWSSASEGQSGLVDLQWLRRLSESRYQDGLDIACGLSSDVEVVSAEHKVIFPPLGSRLDCELLRYLGGMGQAVGNYTFGWAGPWVSALPDLPPGPRVHAVVFDFPRVDVTEMTVAAPRGFRPAGEPVSRKFSGPYGSYLLIVSPEPAGYSVKRALAMFPLRVPAEEYDDLRTFFDEVREADSGGLDFERVLE